MTGFGKYKWLLMDADDTIYDFGKCQHDALWLTLENSGVTPTEDLIEIYDKINISFWKKLELGQIEKSELVWRRFQEFSDRMGLGLDPKRIAEGYESNLALQTAMLDGALETVKALAEKYELYIITNGLETVQTSRFNLTEIKPYFKDIFISGKIGFNKPSAGFFDYVSAAIPGFDKTRALVVGDSLTSDIRGGVSYVLDTCWLNAKGDARPEGLGITYEIRDIRELCGLLENVEKEYGMTKINIAGEEFACAGIGFEKDYSLCMSSFRIGGNADLAVFPENPEQLKKALEITDKAGIRTFIAGNTSNLLFADEGFRGCILFTGKMKGIRIDGSRIYAMAGDSLASVCAAARDASLSGLEFAYGIPGSVGGAVFMNAGAYGGQMSDCLAFAELLNRRTGEILKVKGVDMHFGYRHSLACENRELIVLGAEFELIPGDKSVIEGKMKDYMGRRKSKQPLEYPSAGSVFKRPAQDIYVGKLIEDAGLKGKKIGGAQVSEKHAGFIVNAGGATAADVNALIDFVRAKVLEIYGISIECEIIRVPAAE